MSGDGHSPYLVVSLLNLRKVYAGKIVVWAYPECMDTIKQIAADNRLNISVNYWQPVYRGKNGQFLNKLHMMRTYRGDGCFTNLYFDADTVVNAPIEPLFEMVYQHGFVATQFNDWLSNTGVIRKRILNLLDRDGVDQDAVKKALQSSLPSVNGGVFGCVPTSPALKDWIDWTTSTLDLFIADEVCLHAIVAKHIASEKYVNPNLTVALSGEWNCSPKYKPVSLSPADVKLWHFHGDSNVRPEKSKFGFDLWWPHFQDAMSRNSGNIQSWLPKAKSENRHLAKVLDYVNGTTGCCLL